MRSPTRPTHRLSAPALAWDLEGGPRARSLEAGLLLIPAPQREMREAHHPSSRGWRIQGQPGLWILEQAAEIAPLQPGEGA